MFTFIVEFMSLVLFIGCLWHSARYRGRAFAQQWFITGYLFAIIRETVSQVVFEMPSYAPSILRIGAAPALVSLLWASLFYLAYHFARRFTASENAVPSAAKDYARVAALMFLITASLALPIEATAAQSRWWLYESPAHSVFGGVPFVVPWLWGGAAAIFYAAFFKVQAARLPDRGRLYALITLSPVIAAAQIVYTLILSAVFG